MANNSRDARRIAEKKRKIYVDNYRNRFAILFHNSVKVLNAGDLPKRYLLRVLLEHGGIAYDKQTKLYLRYVRSGIDVYGLPQNYNLIGYNGFTVWRNADEVVILRANDLKYPLQLYLDQQIEKIVDFDMAIEQNLEAIKTMTVAEVQDQSTMLSMANEIDSRRVGATVVFQNKSAMTGNEVKVQSTGAQYLVDKLLEARKEIMNETLQAIGLSVANTDKRERVQTSEIIASQLYTKDCIQTLIDTFNYDAEQGGIPIRLEGNTAVLDAIDIEENEKEGNEE
ncbi:MAG: hypothetical protein J6T10_15325 [Methanobrevibacter sp.]|nr:hypothetical protein [Methanobrevibacter sp.]